MTREEIIAKWDGMIPRERDAWVAEVVFGQSIGRERRINGELFVIDPNAPHGFQRAVPQYTKDISAAWTVADTFNTWQVTRMGVGGAYRYRAIIAKIITLLTQRPRQKRSDSRRYWRNYWWRPCDFNWFLYKY